MPRKKKPTFEERVQHYATTDVFSLHRELLAVRGIKSLLLKKCQNWPRLPAMFLNLETRIERLAVASAKLATDLEGMVEKDVLAPLVDAAKCVLEACNDQAADRIDVPAAMKAIRAKFKGTGVACELAPQEYTSKLLGDASPDLDLVMEIAEARALLEGILASVETVDDFKDAAKLVEDFAQRIMDSVVRGHTLRMSRGVVVEESRVGEVARAVGEAIAEALTPLCDGYQDREFHSTVVEVSRALLGWLGRRDGLSEDEIRERLGGIVNDPWYYPDTELRYVGTPWQDPPATLSMVLLRQLGYDFATRSASGREANRICAKLDSLEYEDAIPAALSLVAGKQ